MTAISLPEERKTLLEQPKIILVEDDHSVSRLLELTLRRAGYDVEVAGTITEARAVTSTVSWDLLLLDRNLPDGDGLDLCRELKSSLPGGYVIMLTGESGEEEKIESFDRGVDDYVTKPFQLPELLARIRAGLRIVELQKDLIDANQQLQVLSTTDALTSVRNRRFLEAELERAFALSMRYQRALSIVMLDVDFFKKVNDTHGHQAGDDVLRCVGETLKRICRRVDVVARYGGEEFVVLLPEIALFDALTFAEKLRATIASTSIRTGNAMLSVSASFGVANFPHTRFSSAKGMLEAADRALYRAKASGRNRVEIERRSDSERRPLAKDVVRYS